MIAYTHTLTSSDYLSPPNPNPIQREGGGDGHGDERGEVRRGDHRHEALEVPRAMGRVRDEPQLCIKGVPR